MQAPNPDSPATYPRRILLAATGMSPQVVTETLYALAVRDAPAFVPTELHLLSTARGKLNAELSLLSGAEWLARLRRDYDLPEIAFSTDHIHVLGGDAPLDDIRTAQDNERAANEIADSVRRLTEDPDSALHVSIAGGRKTMGFYLGYALSLYGRPQDRMSHVLVSPPFESLPDFFYPAPARRVLHDRDNRPLDASEAEVMLASIPFVRLRFGTPERLLGGRETFAEAVAAAQGAIGPADLTIDLRARKINASGTILKLPPRELAFLAWLARRRVRGAKPVRCPPAGAPDAVLGREFLAEYRAAKGELGYVEGTERVLSNGMTDEFFSQAKSRLHALLGKALTPAHANAYHIAPEGPRHDRRFAVTLPPQSIRFETLE